MAQYDLTQIDSLEHADSKTVERCSAVLIDSTHLMLAYADTGAGNDHVVKTFEIDSDYELTELDSLTHDTASGAVSNSLVKIDSTHVALAYQSGAHAGIKVFSVDGSYNITQETVMFHHVASVTTADQDPSIGLLDSTHLIVAYSIYIGTRPRGYIKTLSIDGSYNVTEIDELNHVTWRGGQGNSLAVIDGTHVALACNEVLSPNNHGKLKTFSVDGSYNITEEDDISVTSALGGRLSLVLQDSSHLTLASGESGSDGFIRTFSFDANYDLTSLGSLEHDTHNGYDSSLVKLTDGTLVLAYRGTATEQGVIKSFSLNDSYNITEEDSLTHDSSGCEDPGLCAIDGTHLFLGYAGADDDGYVKTFSIDLPSVSSAKPKQSFII